MKILWLSNCSLQDNNMSSSGTWLYAMSKALLNDDDIELYNITESRVRGQKLFESSSNKFREWVLPWHRYNNYKKNSIIVRDIISLVRPDIIHIWGLELDWAKMYVDGFIKGIVLLEIQGLNYTCAEVCYAGLNTKELLSCIGLKELLFFKKSLIYSYFRYKSKGHLEKELLNSFHNISTQSTWVRSKIAPFLKPDCRIFETGIIVREDFINATPWDYSNTDKGAKLFAIGGAPYKGIHVLLQSLSVIKTFYPDVVLEIAGNIGDSGSILRQTGYFKFIKRLVKKLGLENNVIFVGSLNSKQLVTKMQKCKVFIQSSFVESYSLALAEAMAVGTPCVVSRAGAMPELVEDNISGLLYSSNQKDELSSCIKRLLDDVGLSKTISKNALRVGRERNSQNRVVAIQRSIYNQLIDK